MVDLLIVFNHISFREDTTSVSFSIRNTAGGELEVVDQKSRVDIIESERSFDANGNRQMECDIFAVYLNGGFPMNYIIKPVETDSSLTAVARNTLDPFSIVALGATFLPVSVGNSETRKYLVFNATGGAFISPGFTIFSQRIQISTQSQSGILAQTGELEFESSGAVKVSSEGNLRTYDVFSLTV